MDLQLNSRKAFISGSTQGIGYAIAEGLAREGAEVVLNGRTKDGVDDAVLRLKSAVPGATVSGRAADFGDAGKVDELMAALLALSNGLAKLTRGTEVTVNTVLGGPTYSDGVAGAVAQIAQSQSIAADDMKSAIIGAHQTSLLERFIEPAEIAHLVLYLASPLSSATNGAALRADGGVLTTMI